MKLLIAILFILTGVQIGQAQMDGNPENWCREGFFTKDSKIFEIASVKGPAKARSYFFRDDAEDCPEGESCRAKAYLVPGDKVLVNRKRGAFACAWFVPAKGAPTVSWLKLSDLEFGRQPAIASLNGWLGEWKYADNSISFTHNKLAGFLNVTGDAMWRGLGDNVHIGEIDGRYEPRNGVIEYSDGDGEYDCRATLRLVGNYLIVSDNLRCGGANVSFSGVYIKKR